MDLDPGFTCPMSVSEIMTRDPVTISPGATVRDAIRLLEGLSARHLPVIDGGRLVGLVSDRDLREYRIPILEEIADPEYADSLLDKPVSEAMHTAVVKVDTGEGLKTVVDLMLEYGIGAIPVVDRSTEALVGIVSYVDVLRLVRPSLE